MLNFISTVGPANATLNFTDDLSILLSGLVGLAWLSASMIVAIALRESFSRKAKLAETASTTASDYRLAA